MKGDRSYPEKDTSMNSKHDVEFVIVGNEMLRGDRRDSHLEYLGRRLLGIGVRIDRAHVVGDERGRIAAVVRERLTQSRVLVFPRTMEYGSLNGQGFNALLFES